MTITQAVSVAAAPDGTTPRWRLLARKPTFLSGAAILLFWVICAIAGMIIGLPTLRLLARPRTAIEALAHRLAPALAARLGSGFTVAVVACTSQIGSGALPLEAVASAGLAIRPADARGAGRALSTLAAALRRLRIPVIGRIEDQSLILDLRCLEDEAGFVAN